MRKLNTTLKAQLKFKRVSLRQCAADTRIAASTLVAWGKGDLIGVQTATLDKLCAYFHCQPGDLLRLE